MKMTNTYRSPIPDEEEARNRIKDYITSHGILPKTTGMILDISVIEKYEERSKFLKSLALDIERYPTNQQFSLMLSRLERLFQEEQWNYEKEFGDHGTANHGVSTEVKPHYSKGRLIYGQEEFSPNSKEVKLTLDKLWSNKQVRERDGSILKKNSGRPHPIDVLAEELGVDEVRLRDILTHISKELKRKSIPIKVSQRGKKALMILTNS